jgi:hypothetical protein
MTFELVNTIATVATCLVITATAVAALIQLRHMRAGNQIVAFGELSKAWESSQMLAAHKYIDTQLARDLQDPIFREAIANRLARTDETHTKVRHLLNFGHFFESIAVNVKEGLIPRGLVLRMWSDIIAFGWKRLEPVVAIFRREQDPLAYENFEYLVVLAEDWLAAHPNGAYPPHMRRLKPKDPWLEADRMLALEKKVT